jgi:hypothetical protein
MLYAPLGPHTSAAAESAAPGSCQTHVIDGVIPSWARAGFSSAAPSMHYELGAHGLIAALLWAYPLLSPPPLTHNNKILWVSKVSDDGSPMRMTAQRVNATAAAGPVVHRQMVGGPGPSIINLPTAGCWRVELQWSGHHDTVELEYLPNG